MTTPVALVESVEVQTVLKIDFERDSVDPARVFRAMTGLIDAFAALDHDLVGSLGVSIKPIVLLHDVEAGSLKTRLRTLLESTDDDAIKDFNWKKLVGAYLLRAKKALLHRLDAKPLIESKQEVDAIRQELLTAATETEVARFPTYQLVPSRRLLADVRLIADGVAHLRPGDEASLESEGAPTPISRDIVMPSERAEDLLTRETITGDSVLVLVIKKPDYLGTSMWEFRHGDRLLEAKILDYQWLTHFHARRVAIRPGDALKARVRSEVRYGHDGSIVAQRHFVVEVLEVIQVLEIPQAEFFGDGAA